MTLLFGATLFLSAALLFTIQLMFSKMVLPILGGSPAVWTTCMLFFQAMLLLGYAYAHGTSTALPFRRQVLLHLALLAVSLWFLPATLVHATDPPVDTTPVPWLLAVLAVSLGVPFLLLSTTAPLLQRWFARTGEPGADNPYFLYAASNAGSFLALLSYPTLLEPSLALDEQRRIWSWGYGLLCVAIGLTAFAASRAPEPERAQEDHSPPVAWGDRARWTALAFVPSSLLLGVTSYISTDIAAIPFTWVVPLLLYLLTFILVFARRSLVPQRLWIRLMPWLVVPIVLFWFWGFSSAAPALIVLHLVTFFVIAMVCHGELARRRPPASRLTEFYLWLSLGGALGGVVNGVLAPLIFRGVAEYPLALLAGAFLMPAAGAVGARPSRGVAAAMVVIAAVALASVNLLAGNIREPTGALTPDAILPVSVATAIAAASCLALRSRPHIFALGLGVVLLLGWLAPFPGRDIQLHAERSFFGVHRVKVEHGGRYHTLYHGTTLHGAEAVAPEDACKSLSYYTRQGPLGRALAALPVREGRRVGVVGLGAGSIAAYAKPGETWTFFEIDPVVERIARNPRYFRYLTSCLDTARVVLGDGRLKLARAPDAGFDLLVLDAFSSDAVPVHLLTREALAVYRAKLAEGGAILFHLSNRHLNLAPVLAAVARDAGMIVRFGTTSPTTEAPGDFLAASLWAVVAREENDLGAIARDSSWHRPPAGSAERVWTDDYSNVWGALAW